MPAPRRMSKSVVLHREVLDEILLGYADGLQEVGEKIIEEARPNTPDQPPYGVGLVETGRAVTFVNGQRVGGTGRVPASAAPKSGGIVTVVGYAFPANFLELGTIYISPRPWITPAIASQTGANVVAVVVAAIKRRIGRRGR